MIGKQVIIFLGIVSIIILISLVSAREYKNATDGFPTIPLSGSYITSICGNETDFFMVTDDTSKVPYGQAPIFHRLRNGTILNNIQTNLQQLVGIDWNHSDFWLADSNGPINHTNYSGYTINSAQLTYSVTGIWKDTSNFYFPSVNIGGYFYTDDNFNIISTVDTTSYEQNGYPTSMSGNDTDIYILDDNGSLYHTLKDNTLIETIDLSIFTDTDSSIDTLGLYIENASNPDSIWFSDITDKFVYHILSDDTPPEVNINYPLNGSKYTNNISIINYTIIEKNPGKCWYSLDDGLTNSTKIEMGFNFTGLISNEGWNNWTVYCEDLVSYTNSSITTFYKDSISPNLKVDSPLYQFYSTNISLSLNYTVQDMGIGLDSCWFSIYNSTNSLMNISGDPAPISLNYTLINCLNFSFNLTRSDRYYISIWVNDSLNNINTTTINFALSLEAPAVVLNWPSGEPYFNKNNNYFNYTATNINGLSTCELWGDWGASWSNKYIWINPTNSTMNWTLINIPEGDFIYNVWCNNTLNNGGWAIDNKSFTVDTTYPIVLINSVQTSPGSKLIAIQSNQTDKNLYKCKYSIYNSTGQIDNFKSNITFSCNSPITMIVSSFDTYEAEIYGSDLAGNENSSKYYFTTYLSGGGSGGGGGITTVIVQNNTNEHPFCGDGICQDNSMNGTETYFTCSQDCPAANIDTIFTGCIDKDSNTECIWNQITYQYIGLFSIIFLGLLIFATTTDKKTHKQVNVFRYYVLNRMKGGKKLKIYRKI